MLLHANPVNVADGLQRAGVTSESGHGTGGHMPTGGTRPPPTFRTTARAPPAADALSTLPVPTTTGRTKLAPLNATNSSLSGPQAPKFSGDPSSSKAGPGHQQQQQQQAANGGSNPAKATTYQTAHHALLPHTRVKISSHSARGARGTQSALQRLGLGDIASALPGSDLRSKASSGPGDGAWGGRRVAMLGPGALGGASSVGDLEALDAILDQLVVLDVRMRQALLKGPLVSFETVVSESATRQGGLITHTPDDAHARDHTFLTSVHGVVEEAPEEETFAQQQQDDQQGQWSADPVAVLPPAGEADVLEHLRQAGGGGGGGSYHHGGGGDAFAEGAHVLPEPQSHLDALRGAMPVPILPKLARMYITSKAASVCKAPPPAPPTAQWLLRTRLPVPPAEAPSYDHLVTQIRDVQRQYTCGTARDKATLAVEAARAGGLLGTALAVSGTPRSALDAYISGIDGPALADVVAPQLAPTLAERSRPTFVSMRRAAHSARPLSSSLGRVGGVCGSPRSRSPINGRGPSPGRGTAGGLGAVGPHVSHPQDVPGTQLQASNSGHESN